MPTAVSNFEKFKKDFIDACNKLGFELVERKKQIECIADDDVRIVLDKNGKWIKAYLYDPRFDGTKLWLWDKPKEIIHGKGGLYIETEKGFIDVKRRGAIYHIDAEEFIHPDFKEEYSRKVRQAKMMTEKRIIK